MALQPVLAAAPPESLLAFALGWSSGGEMSHVCLSGGVLPLQAGQEKWLSSVCSLPRAARERAMTQHCCAFSSSYLYMGFQRGFICSRFYLCAP